MDSLAEFAILIWPLLLFVIAGVFGEPRRRSVPTTAGAQHVHPPAPQPVAPATSAHLVQQSIAQRPALSDAKRRLSDLSDVAVRRRGRGSGRRRQRSGSEKRENGRAVGDGAPDVGQSSAETGSSSADVDSQTGLLPAQIAKPEQLAALPLLFQLVIVIVLFFFDVFGIADLVFVQRRCQSVHRQRRQNASIAPLQLLFTIAGQEPTAVDEATVG